MRLSVGDDFIETHVERDPVTLRWEWRGYTLDASDRELHDTEEAATKAALHWALVEARRRAKNWANVVALVESSR